MKMSFKDVLFVMFAMLLMYVLFGCSPAKIGAKAVNEYKASSKFPADCATSFPPIITEGETKVDTTESEDINCDDIVRKYNEFWEGVSTESEKERKALADTIAAMLARGETPPTKIVRCPPSTHSVRVDTVESTAKLEASTRLYNELALKYAADTSARSVKQARTDKKLAATKNQRNYAYGLSAFLIALIGVSIYLKTKKKLFV